MHDDTMWQIADVIVGEHDDEKDAAEWTRRILTEYPGCCAAVGIGADGDWILVRVRGEACPE